ncbi:MAG: ABC transporter ATP-binding protein [Verrucomicrobiota bacterium]|jgi:iron complex transport system ATP-binding protein
MSAAVVCRNVSAGYRQQPVLHDISLTIQAGQMVALLGPNGAGKSTLLRVLTGLQPLTGGDVQLFGRDLRQLRATERARLVAVVPQEVTTPMAFTVAELVALGRSVPRGRWSALAAADRQAVEQALAYTDTLELRDRYYSELSGGEKQRAIIAMALAQEPQLLLLDEPTSHLDINHRLEVLQLLDRLNRERGLTVVMTSHDLNLAAEFFPYLALLDHGRIKAVGVPADVLRENLLEETYHCKLAVRRDATGLLLVLPTRTGTAPTGKRVHVICGGGSGVEVLRRLCLAGWQVSCGALNQGDTDAQTAGAFGIATALEKPFSPLSDGVLAAAGKLAQAADVIVVCEVPFGSGNLKNLDLARQAGKPVLVNTRQVAVRDFTPQREVPALIRALVERGATPWEQVGDLFIELAKVR